MYIESRRPTPRARPRPQQLGAVDGFFDEFVSNTWSSAKDAFQTAKDVAPAAIRLSFAPITMPVMSIRALAMGEGKEGIIQAAQTTVTDPGREVLKAAAPILPYVPYGNLALLVLTLDQLRAKKAAERDNERAQAEIQKEIDAVEAKIRALENKARPPTAGAAIGAQSAAQNSPLQTGYEAAPEPEKTPLPWGTIAKVAVAGITALTLLK